ncbi:hypothetical protein DFH09DRAFT_1098048 [Mycena vulgaris]|nr:hypothetical protein DFH09DRAFT_1098048 [Mycena vulgaris]
MCIIALGNIASVMVIGILYGLPSGVCQDLSPLPVFKFPPANTDFHHMGELGSLTGITTRSLRMGVSFAVVGLGGLIGPPNNDVLPNQSHRVVASAALQRVDGVRWSVVFRGDPACCAAPGHDKASLGC